MKKLFTFLLLIMVGTASFDASAQLIPGTKEETEATVPDIPADSLGRRTPRGTVSGFLQAMADQNYQRASQYLVLKKSLRSDKARKRFIVKFQKLLDQTGHMMPYSWLSDAYPGNTDDELPAGVDLVGTLDTEEETITLYVENTQPANSPAVWKFSSETIDAIAKVSVADDLLLNRLLPQYLQDTMFAGVPIGHWFAILLLIAFAYYVSWAIMRVIHLTIRLVWKQARVDPASGVIVALELPFRIYLAVWLFVIGSREVGISIVVRQRLSGITIIIGLVALLILLWRLTDFISNFSKATMNRRGRISAISVILFLRRFAKVAIVVFGIIAVLGTLGFDVTTGLAALGIGGIALALGAQKTVENFVGSVTLITDQPIRVGDYCKVGETSGTVESIGMRSTRIRTDARTVVTIPNGDFSATRIENYAPRERFLFNPILDLRYETTPDQIRYLLVELRSILYSHPKINPDPARVRFVSLAASSLQIKIYCYVETAVYDEFLEIQEDLLLRIMDIVAASGADFAFPSQTLYMARDKGISEEKVSEVAGKVKEWTDSEDVQLPNFSPERIAELKNTLVYPAKGSTAHKVKTAEEKPYSDSIDL
ncbi:MAG TPA: mechanosensitive ion channel family protein [Flavobacterium sp.]|jgi:MscS family membrane protein